MGSSMPSEAAEINFPLTRIFSCPTGAWRPQVYAFLRNLAAKNPSHPWVWG